MCYQKAEHNNSKIRQNIQCKAKATAYKAPFVVTQLNSTGRPVESSCVAINGA